MGRVTFSSLIDLRALLLRVRFAAREKRSVTRVYHCHDGRQVSAATEERQKATAKAARPFRSSSRAPASCSVVVCARAAKGRMAA
jgi:hypothetical protein